VSSRHIFPQGRCCSRWHVSSIKAIARDVRVGGGIAIGLFVATIACAQSPAWPVVSPPEQASRDVSRLEVLESELAAEEAAAAQATKRRAERLTANDSEGVREAEETLAQHGRNLQALHVEIEGVRSRLRSSWRAAADSTGAAARPMASRGKLGPPPRAAQAWWDVYAKKRPEAGKPETTEFANPVRDSADLAPSRPRSVYRQKER
jgi:hypothetical protein